MKLIPHPYALMLPALTDDEYAALREDIAAHGILYPIITDENGAILDGVHRHRIAEELGIDLPVSRHEGLDDDRKLHLAVGLNMRRRHLDTDRRRELVRQLSKEHRMSLRRIASVTGWSKSTIARDLKASPFESMLSRLGQLRLEDFEDEKVREIVTGVFDAQQSLLEVCDAMWKAGSWPPATDEGVLVFVIGSWLPGAMFSRPPADPKLLKFCQRVLADDDYRAEILAKPVSPEFIDGWRQRLSQLGHTDG